MNNGDGAFAPQVSYNAGSGTNFVAIGDLNADGMADLVLTNEFDDAATVLLNRGNGIFVNQGAYRVGQSPNSIAMGDLNADGLLDLAITNDDDSVSVLLHSASGCPSP